MNRTLIYIGDDLLDLDISTVIAITIQAINAGDLKLRNVSYTNQFKVKDTENNCRILGYVNNEWSASAKPYQYNDCKVVQDGIETLKGLLIITKFKDGYFYCNIYEDLFDIFAYLEGKKIKDIDPIADTAWDAAYMDSARNATSGVISAILQWGKFNGIEIFNSDFFMPCFYYHSFITEILGETGLTLSGDILTDARFTDLVIPFPGDEFDAPASLTAEVNFIAKGTGSFGDGASVTPTFMGGIVAGDLLIIQILNNQQGGTIGSVAAAGGIAGWSLMEAGNFKDAFTNNVGNGEVYYKTATGSESGTVTITRTGSTGYPYRMGAQIYQFRGTSNLTIEDSNVKSDGDGSSTITWSALTLAGANRTLIAFLGQADSSSVTPPPGYTQAAADNVGGDDEMSLFCFTKEDTDSDGSVTSPDGLTDGWISFHVSLYNNDNLTVDWNLYWPDIEVKDILKDFFVRFGLIAKQKDGVLYLKTLEAIISDRTNAVDWSSKLVKSPKDIDFTTKYAQDNYFDYQNGVNDPTVGRGIMEIDNETIPPIDTLFTSIFSSVPTQDYYSYTMNAVMNIYDEDSVDITDISNSPAFTLLTLRDPSVDDPNVTFLSTARHDYKMAYFIDADQPKDSGFQYFVDQFYPKFEAALQKNKVIEKQYLLTELDIAGYDSHKIMYDGEGYYIINKIKNFVSGRITKVELFKVG